MIKPPKLQSGDRIRIVFPASPVRSEFFEPGVEALRQLGFQVTFGNPYRNWRYLAGTDQERKAELLDALRDPDVKAIFFARGGYGSGRLLTTISDFNDLRAVKILHGCSDITSLHQYFQQEKQWVVFHGPMPSGDFARNQVHIESLQKALMQAHPYVLQPGAVQTLVGGSAEGILTGGCLSLLQTTIGTRWEPDWNDTILFLEDVGAKPYQIDRMLTQFKIAGKLAGVTAFIFGEMKDCIQIENQGYTLQEVIVDLLADLGKPIFFGFPSGHVSGLNWTLPFGVRARIHSTPGFALEILEGAVQ